MQHNKGRRQLSYKEYSSPKKCSPTASRLRDCILGANAGMGLVAFTLIRCRPFHLVLAGFKCFQWRGRVESLFSFPSKARQSTRVQNLPPTYCTRPPLSSFIMSDTRCRTFFSSRRPHQTIRSCNQFLVLHQLRLVN